MNPNRAPVVAFAVALALLFTGSSRSWAAGDTHDHDHDRARRALEAGEILPLRAILGRVEYESPGQILEVELDRDDAGWVYEIKVLRAGGSMVKLKFDARDGTLLGSKEGRYLPGGKPGKQ